MPALHPQSSKMSRVLRLTTTLADRVLDADVANRQVPEEHIAALRSAARLLREHDVPQPPTVDKALSRFIERHENGRHHPQAEPVEHEVHTEREHVDADLRLCLWRVLPVTNGRFPPSDEKQADAK